jgi:hypothetical protein
MIEKCRKCQSEIRDEGWNHGTFHQKCYEEWIEELYAGKVMFTKNVFVRDIKIENDKLVYKGPKMLMGFKFGEKVMVKAVGGG